MSDCLSDLELHFSNLGSFVTMVFDAKTMGVCIINLGRPKIIYENCFSIFEVFWIASYWDIHNAFVFYGSFGVKAYLRKLTGVPMWPFSLLEQVEILSLVECSSFLLSFHLPPLE